MIFWLDEIKNRKTEYSTHITVSTYEQLEQSHKKFDIEIHS